MQFKFRQHDRGLVVCEANGIYTVEQMHDAQKQLTMFIEEQGNQESVVILDLRTATMPREALRPSMWTSFFKLEHPSIKAYVLVGKSMYLSIFGNLVMRLFSKNIIYARTMEQAEQFAYQLMDEYFESVEPGQVV